QDFGHTPGTVPYEPGSLSSVPCEILLTDDCSQDNRNSIWIYMSCLPISTPLPRKKLLMAIALCGTTCCMTSSLLAQSGESIGTVLVTKGQVEARAVDGTIRTLARGFPLFEQDAILIGADGYAQV